MNPSYEDWEFFLNCAKKGAKWEHIHAPFHVYHRNPTGRDAESQTKSRLLKGKLQGCHQDIYGMGKGEVAFVIPCYNHEEFVGDAIQSALDQIYPHVKVIVVDDGSPGNVLPEIKDKFSDNVILVRQKNKHLSGARNTGIEEAMARFNPEYLVCLDADDTLHPNFVEDLMPEMRRNEYVYCDVRFIGDAWHVFPVSDFDCRKLAKKHLHPCAFLMQSKMYLEVVGKRGYGYDENMKEGYEDWEFAVASVESGWCGRRHPDPLFNYRFHAKGSMRTEAAKKNKSLVNYITDQHPWMKGNGKMPCGTCGGRKYTRRVIQTSNNGVSKMMINIPAIGEVDGREPLSVTYVGPRRDTMTKIGRGLPGQGAKPYKFSGDPHGTFKPTFTIFAVDAHLFGNSAFRIEKFKVELEPEPVKLRVPEPVKASVAPIEAIQDREGRLKAKLVQPQVIAYDPDDFTQIKGVGPSFAKRLQESGYSYFQDLVNTTDKELADTLGIGLAKAGRIRKSAENLHNV